jgi:pilus assembly protein Flp/PilA
LSESCAFVTRSGDNQNQGIVVNVRKKVSAVEAHPMNDFRTNDDGQGLVEYALIIAVIAIAVIVALIFLRDQITNIFSNIGNNLT